MRFDAMIAIWNESGFEGVSELIASSGAIGIIGRYASVCVTDFEPRVKIILQCLSIDGDLRSKYEWCIQGFVSAIDDDSRHEVLRATANKLPKEEKVRLFKCTPFKASTWRLVEEYDD